MNDELRRIIQGKVELYNGSTHLNTFLATDKLQEIVIARAGEKGKFFGFGICQQATVKIMDKAGDLTFLKGESLRTSFRANEGDYTTVCPSFYIKDVQHDEKTSVYTLTAYDALDAATARVWADLGIIPPYTLSGVVARITSLLGLSGYTTTTGFDLLYENGANFAENDDTTIRTVLNAIAEVTQTIYYVDNNNRLVFRRLTTTGDPVLAISKRDYFELTTALPVTISKIMSVTELGDNVYAGEDSGVCQYVRDNPFWNTRTDLDTLLPIAFDRIAGLTIVPHNIKWRGNFLTEICDKVSIETKDGSSVITYILDDSFTYTGGFSQNCTWDYNPDSDKTTASNPVTLGEKLNQTFARVDKANREIALVASEVNENREEISSLKVTTDSISSEVGRVEDLTEVNSTAISSVKQTADELTAGLEKVDQKADLNKENTDAELLTLRSQIDVKLDTSSFEIELNEALTQGVEQLTVKNRNFNFGYDGLTISDDHADISTNVDIDGLSVNQRSNEVLKAGAIYDTNGNKTIGVTTANLHAKTYLWVGDNSRFEDYVNGTRTGCFWVG